MAAPASSRTLLVTTAVIAGVAQIFAGIYLALAPEVGLREAAAAGPHALLAALAGAAICGLLAYTVRRRRPLAIALVTAGALLGVGVSRQLSTLGLVYYGELVLHHFLALVAAAIAVVAGHGLLRRADLGRLRGVPLLLISLGALGLLGEHVARSLELDLAGDRAWLPGSVPLLLGLPAALVVAWPALLLRERVLVLAVLGPLAARLVIGGAPGIAGSAPGVSAALPMTITLGIAGLAAFFLLGPRIERRRQLLAIVAATAGSYILHTLYHARRFDRYEESLGGLVRSLVGFDLPYPSFVAGWRIALVTVAIFALLKAIVAGLLDRQVRPWALALTLVVVAGYGLTNPQLVLMQVAGVLALITSLAEAPLALPEVLAPVGSPPPEEPELVLIEVAERLDLPPPVVVEGAAETVLALRGEHRRLALDLRARSADGRRWIVRLRLGVVGRSAPAAEVLPDDTRGHRLRGDPRLVGGEESGILTALAAFPGAVARFWEAGVEIDLGEDLGRLRASSLEALLRALGRHLRRGDSVS